jgi:hypothetical protein
VKTFGRLSSSFLMIAGLLLCWNGIAAAQGGAGAGELEQPVKLDPRADPTNYYLLGVAQRNSMHYRETAAEFSKCAEFKGNLQATCKDSAAKDTTAAAAR